MIRKLVLLRDGESEWNKMNLYTGWADSDLSEKGRKEALILYSQNETPEDDYMSRR